MRISIVGKSLLVLKAMSEPDIGKIRDKQQKEAKAPRKRKNSKADFCAARYMLPDGKREGVQAIAFKCAMADAASTYFKGQGITKKLVEGTVFIHGEGPKSLLVLTDEKGKPLKGKMREDVVKIPSSGAADLRYRPYYEVGWHAELDIEFEFDVISSAQLLSVLQRAGMSIGVGEYRPQRRGDWGRFEIDRSQSIDVIRLAVE